ncbi:hypothetical protein SLINC_4340 [Streptomyces lincolnensis]|uniref:Uncharacterized protein n=1 Tax=Streptomyces lincolnensis TaxID=1915 RepID=A0A1B1MDC7_STRLN|nr:FHA domain-containing protein [Streptomyces lincolnensis]ANS66564.1 hypothetical protein SLINC_4340 [Streptomyces lincolnensis]AXG55434.1 hypothetical protein SLCG_4279 [Streptomyces lincolnensis]
MYSSNGAHSVIVVPRHRRPYAPSGGRRSATAQIRLAPGEQLAFGRVPAGDHERGLTLRHEGIQHTAGLITAYRAYWTLTNLSPCQTYLVENPEGAGEHIKVGPGRREAPIPFEFGRVVLPTGQELIDFDVWATCHDYQGGREGREGQDQAPALPAAPALQAFPLDRTRRYFLVLASLCEPRLREAPFARLPSTRQIIERLRPAWPAVSKSAVQWSVDYLAEKLCLTSARHSGKRESLVSLALRFDLVREDDLALLNRRRQAS